MRKVICFSFNFSSWKILVEFQNFEHFQENLGKNSVEFRENYYFLSYWKKFRLIKKKLLQAILSKLLVKFPKNFIIILGDMGKIFNLILNNIAPLWGAALPEQRGLALRVAKSILTQGTL